MNNLKSKNILVVDDEEGYRELFHDEFTSFGANVTTAKDGIEAYQLLLKQKFDVVVSDVRMPGMDGISLLKKIKDQDVGIFVFVFITGHADVANEIAYQEGAEGIFQKPVDLGKLTAEISHSLLPNEEKLKQGNNILTGPFMSVEIKSEGIEEAIKTNLIAFGRGGVLLRLDTSKPIKKNAQVEIFIKNNEKIIFQARGICRTLKKIEKDDVGAGVEFFELGACSLEIFLDHVKKLKPVPFIPSFFEQK